MTKCRQKLGYGGPSRGSPVPSGVGARGGGGGEGGGEKAVPATWYRKRTEKEGTESKDRLNNE